MMTQAESPSYDELFMQLVELNAELKELRERHAELEAILREKIEQMDPSLSEG